MKWIFLAIFGFGFGFINAQKVDTINIDANNLKIDKLHFGKTTYLVYNRFGKDKPAKMATIVHIDVAKETLNNTDVVSITQKWEMDTVIHTAKSIITNNSFKTLYHNSWWKQKKYTEIFDYIKKEATFDGIIKDSLKAKTIRSFEASINSNFLNWHSDLIVFPLLPLRANCVFKIYFYEPGSDKPKYENYEVIKSEKIKQYNGVEIDCWVLEFKSEKPKASQRFWIAKKEREVIKEEDSFNGMFRYKFKVVVGE